VTRPITGEAAPDAALVDLEGREVMLASVWRERPAVLVFLRYFGCPLCQRHVVDLREGREEFQRAGANVVLIGQGSAQEAGAFHDRRNLPFPCLVDASRIAYHRYGLIHGKLSQVFGPKVVGPLISAALQPERRQRGLSGGHFLQMPGTFVVDVQGTVRYVHRNITIADNPPNDLLLEILDDLAGRGDRPV
jgi:peroxiredoxin